MKRLTGVLLALALLWGMGACGEAEVEPTTTAVAETTTEALATEEPTTMEAATEEPTTKYYAPPVPPEKPSEFIYTPTYAVSKTHFYGVCSGGGYNFKDADATLRRVPLKNISKSEEIPLPKTYKGNDLEGLYICGLTKDWLFISRHISDDSYHFVTYRISVKNFKTEVLDYGKYGDAPWYNAASHSLLFMQLDEDSNILVEAMRLDSKKRTTIWTEPSRWVEYWRNTADGMVSLDGGYDAYWPKTIIIDKDNRAVPMNRDDVHFPERKSDSHPVVKELLEQDRVLAAAACGRYIYYVEYVGEINLWDVKNFYRMKADGSEKKLLREETNIFSLFAVQEKKLFCLANRPTNDETMGFYSMDENGMVIDMIATDSTYDSGHSLDLINGLMLMNLHVIYGNSSGYFHTLYDPATGAIFSSEGA